MPLAVAPDVVVDPVESGTLACGSRHTVGVEQVRVEFPADDLVVVEVDLQHAGLAGQAPAGMPDEVSQRVGDQLAADELDGLQDVRVVTDDGVGTGEQQLPSDVLLLARRAGVPLDAPVDDHYDHVGAAGGAPHARDHRVQRPCRGDTGPVGTGRRHPRHDHGGSHECHAHIPGDVQYPVSVGLGVVGAGSERHNSGCLQQRHAVEQSVLAVVPGVVVRQAGDIDTGARDPIGR